MTTNILKDINSSYIYEIATNLKPLINKDITSDIINSIKNKTYPITIILLKNAELIGFYQITAHDNDFSSYSDILIYPLFAKYISKEVTS